MKNKFVFLSLSFLVVFAIVLTSCSKSTTTTTTTTSSQTSTPTMTTSSTSVPTSVTSTALTTSSTAVSVSTTSTGNWWDSLGTPQYGGTITMRENADVQNWDPYYSRLLTTIQSAYMEKLFAYNWTLDPTVYDYPGQFCPNQYISGMLSTDYEFSAPNTIVIHLRQGIDWQNIAPANGREFIASDVVYDYDRICGLGDGFTTHTPYPAGYNSTYYTISSVTAPDNFTVVFTFSVNNPEFILETLQASATSEQCLECPDVVQAYGNLNIDNWHDALGTGPFILTDFVDNSSATLVKNPYYWGHDERYPQNKLPYVNGLNILIIPDDSTALAGLRTGKIDELDREPIQDSQDLKQSNPQITQIEVPWTVGCLSIDPKNNTAPYNNINVRIALQEAINLPQIAQQYYLGASDPDPQSLLSSYEAGYGFPYSDWPTSLQTQYAYNPTNAKALLAAAGFPNGFTTDIVVDTGYDMNLLQIVQSDFAAIGVNMSIKTMDITTWESYVETNHSNDALSSRSSASYLGITTEPIGALTRESTLANTDGSVVNSATLTADYNAALAAPTLDQTKQIIQQACQYVSTQQFEISLLQPNSFCFVQPWLGGYSGQYAAFSGGSSGPSLLCFFEARLWINQNLK